MWVVEVEMFLAGGKMLFWGQESISLLCAAVVVCLQEQVGYLEVKDWEEVQMRQSGFHFPQPAPLCTEIGQTYGSYFHSKFNMLC